MRKFLENSRQKAPKCRFSLTACWLHSNQVYEEKQFQMKCARKIPRNGYKITANCEHFLCDKIQNREAKLRRLIPTKIRSHTKSAKRSRSV